MFMSEDGDTSLQSRLTNIWSCLVQYLLISILALVLVGTFKNLKSPF